jgi:hypothetical protein
MEGQQEPIPAPPAPPPLPPLVDEADWMEAMVAFEEDHRRRLALRSLYRRIQSERDTA